jgi:hypothetical protein
MHRAATSFLAALLAAIAAAAPAAAADRDGVWQGMIGTLPVRACFMSRDWGDFGAYYYLSQRKLIALEPEEGNSSAFREGDARQAANPLWSLRTVAGDALEGQWSQGKRTLPVRLMRVAAAIGEEGPCGSLAFHGPRLEGVRTVRSRASMDGVAYTRLVLSHGGRYEASVETFALGGAKEADRRIDAALRESFDGSPAAWFDCVRGALAFSPHEGSIDETQAPAFVTARWLSVKRQSDSFCGGNHPNSFIVYRTFDRRTGAELDPLDWFDPRAVKRTSYPETGDKEPIPTLLPALRKAVMGAWKEEGECKGVVSEQEFWNLGLGRTGFVFTPSLPRVVMACGETFTIPYARLARFLTPAGAREVKALQAELARLR